MRDDLPIGHLEVELEATLDHEDLCVEGLATLDPLLVCLVLGTPALERDDARPLASAEARPRNDAGRVDRPEALGCSADVVVDEQQGHLNFGRQVCGGSFFRLTGKPPDELYEGLPLKHSWRAWCFVPHVIVTARHEPLPAVCVRSCDARKAVPR